MKEKILNLKSEGKSYGEIAKILNCSKGTISYYCGEGQKEKTIKRTQKRRENILLKKIETFKNNKYTLKTSKKVSIDNFDKNIKNQITAFQKRDNESINNFNKNIEKTFTWEDVIDKFGEETICYLTGEKINLFKKTYSLDHITPTSKGGDNSFSNLGILLTEINQMKHNMTPEELILWCVKILKFNGYTVLKN